MRQVHRHGVWAHITSCYTPCCRVQVIIHQEQQWRQEDDGKGVEDTALLIGLMSDWMAAKLATLARRSRHAGHDIRHQQVYVIKLHECMYVCN